MTTTTQKDAPVNTARFSWPGGKRAAVSVSFDDGRATQLDVGMPILDRHGVRGTFYLSLFPHLDARLNDWKAAGEYRGHEMGNHTMSHPCSGNFHWAKAKRPLESLTLEDMEWELTEANKKIREMFGITPTTFAYPCGQTFVGRGLGRLKSYIPLVGKHFVAGRGFRNESHNDPTFCDLARVEGYDFDDSPFERAKGFIDLAVQHGGWVVLVGQEVGDGGKQIVHAEALDQVCRYCQDPANGIWIDTVAAVAQHVKANRAE